MEHLFLAFKILETNGLNERKVELNEKKTRQGNLADNRPSTDQLTPWSEKKKKKKNTFDT